MKRFVIEIDLSGDKEGVLYNLNAIIDGVDPTFLDSCSISVANFSGEVEDDA